MPCTFDYVTYPPRYGDGWRSRDQHAAISNELFIPMTDMDGNGTCGHCGVAQGPVAWGSNQYILCVECAVILGGPDLRAVMPQLFLDHTGEEEDENNNGTTLTTKRDKDFDPANYRPFRHSAALTGRYGCQGYRCTTYSAPGRTIPAGNEFMMSDDVGYLCMACFQKLKEAHARLPARVICSQCERRCREEQMQTTVHDGRVCNRCIAGHYIATPHTDNGWILRGTAARMVAAGQNVYASPQWAERNWFRGADRWYTTEAERDRAVYAADEAYRTERLANHALAAVFSYGTNVIKMHGFPTVTKADDLCFGVELEMQPKSGHTQPQVTAILGGKYVATNPYILCADSSIGSAGVEMITLPYTLANHKSDKYVQWTKLLGELRKVAQSGQNTTACGMHVHINRRALSNLQMGKMLVIINAPEMQELIVTIAQRSETSYARRFYKKVTEGGKIIGSHGDALNMSNNKGTCELRIFRGNLRYERVMKNLEFAEALCMYANEQSIQKLADPALLFSWINDNKGHYPHLAKFLREEYTPTKSFARYAARARKNDQWNEVCTQVMVEPTEGDI